PTSHPSPYTNVNGITSRNDTQSPSYLSSSPDFTITNTNTNINTNTNTSHVMPINKLKSHKKLNPSKAEEIEEWRRECVMYAYPELQNGRERGRGEEGERERRKRGGERGR